MSSDVRTQLADTRVGDHLCLLYGDDAERAAAFSEFLAAGLAAGDCCVLVADPPLAKDVKARLADGGVAVEAEMARGALIEAAPEAVYLLFGSWDAGAARARLADMSAVAQRRGFETLRVVGDTRWALSRPGCVEALGAYEASLSHLFRDAPILALCGYDRDRTPAEVLRKILDVHPVVAVGMDVYGNPFFEPSDEDGPGASEVLERSLHELRRLRSHHEDGPARERAFGVVAEHASDIIMRLDLDGRHLYVNRRAEEATGLSRAEMVGRTNAELGMPPELAAAWDDAVGRVKRTGEPVTLEFEYPAPSGPRWYRSRIVPEPDETGEVSTVLAMTRDMTAQRNAERALAAANEAIVSREHLLHAVLETSPVAIVLVDPEWRVQLWNRAAEELFGWSADEVLGQPYPVRMPPGSDQAVERLFENARAGITHRGLQLKRLARDGTELDLSFWNARLDGPDGELAGLVGIFADNAERNRLEAELRQSQKMEAVGRLAGGVAHDFNNMLTSILGHAALVLDTLAPDDPARADVEEIHRSGDRARILTRQLLAFSRKQVLSPRVLDLRVVLHELERMLVRIIGEDVELTIDVTPDLWPVQADRGQIEQALLNLAVNARDAMPGGGELRISARNLALRRSTRNRPDLPPLDYVVIEVRDTGVGIEDEVLGKIFEPFFTTKEPGKGTGLGLSTVYGIVAQTGGRILVDSSAGKGTTFCIYLPRSLDEVSVPTEPVSRPLPTGATATVLVVEDEAGVRSLARRVLMKHGFRVVEAASGEEALLTAEQHGSEIEIVVSDLVMPRMGGRELVDRLLVANPELAVVLMSGYSEALVARRGGIRENELFLEKPFTPQALVEAVRTAHERRLRSGDA